MHTDTKSSHNLLKIDDLNHASNDQFVLFLHPIVTLTNLILLMNSLSILMEGFSEKCTRKCIKAEEMNVDELWSFHTASHIEVISLIH